MKGLFSFILFLSGFVTASAQIQVDSLNQKLDAVKSKIDIDSVQRNIQLPDSLFSSFAKIDSIRNNFNLAADSLQSDYRKTIHEIDTRAVKINNIIDSVQHLNVPANKYKGKLDKLEKLRRSTETKFVENLAVLKLRTAAKLDALDPPSEYREPLQMLKQKLDGINLTSENLKIPELNIPGYNLPEVKGVGNLPSKAGKLPNLERAGNLPAIDASEGELGKVTQQIQGYESDIKSITDGNLADVEGLPQTIESQASRVDGMDELQKQSSMIDEQKVKVDEFKDPAKAKEKAVEIARKAAVNHFVGKEEQLKAAMEKISRYKQKYSSVSSIKDLPKRPPNPMKGKPFIERLIPGVFFQYQQKDSYFLDVNPYVGYRWTGRLSAGLGWNHRYSYDRDRRNFNSRSRIFGPRGYIDFKLGKGFIAHMEGESMNTFVPSTLRGNPDTGHREWVWSFMTGIKKEYKIYKNLKGTALIQYNWINRHYKAPYVDRLNSRIGFEYMLKSKQNKK